MATFDSNSFDFNMKMNILITLKMPFLILSTILDLMLVLFLVNYFGKQIIYTEHILYSEK